MRGSQNCGPWLVTLHIKGGTAIGPAQSSHNFDNIQHALCQYPSDFSCSSTFAFGLF